MFWTAATGHGPTCWCSTLRGPKCHVGAVADSQTTPTVSRDSSATCVVPTCRSRAEDSAPRQCRSTLSNQAARDSGTDHGLELSFGRRECDPGSGKAWYVPCFCCFCVFACFSSSPVSPPSRLLPSPVTARSQRANPAAQRFPHGNFARGSRLVSGMPAHVCRLDVQASPPYS